MKKMTDQETINSRLIVLSSYDNLYKWWWLLLRYYEKTEKKMICKKYET